MSFLQEYRCKCGKLLFKGNIKSCEVGSKIEIKCKRCGEIKLIDFSNEIKPENKMDNFNANKRRDS